LQNLIFELELERPKEPPPSMCCASGCMPCVFDSYNKNLQYHEEKLA